MWCPACRADVAAELSSDNRRMNCARCQTELGIAASANLPSAATSPTEGMERDARALLARWSTQNVIESPSIRSSSYGSTNLPGDTQLSAGRVLNELDRVAIASAQMAEDRPVRSAMSSTGLAAFNEIEERAATVRPQPALQHFDPTERRTESTAANATESHPASPREPADQVGPNHEIDLHPQLPHSHPVRSNISAIVGQVFAYLGVFVLTGGTVMSVFSFFGGPENLMPIGLLTAAGGQMILFLGVVTLISSGMERAVSEMIWRIDHLAEEVLHMGLALDDLEHGRNNHHHFERSQAEREKIAARRAA